MDGQQCVTVPKMLNDTDTNTFFQYQIISIPIPILFSVPNFSDTGSETFFPIPNFSDTGSETFFGTKFFRYRFRYHLKKSKIPGTGSGTHYKSSEFQNFGNKNQLRYQIFPIPVPRLFSGTKFFRYRFRDFFRYQFFPIPVPRLFSGTNFFRYRFRYHQKNEKFPVPGIPGTGTSHSDGQQGAGMSKKERGNEAVRQFRKRKKVKEEADKEKTERLRKENLELESRVASYQQELDFMVEVVRAHADLDGNAFPRADPSFQEFLQ